MISPASFNLAVIIISSGLGSGLPLGWLWAHIIDALLRLMAGRNTSLGWTMLAFSEPIEIISLPMTPFFVFKNKQMNCSCFKWRKSGSSSSYTSLGDRIFLMEDVGADMIWESFKVATICLAFIFPIPSIASNSCSVISISSAKVGKRFKISSRYSFRAFRVRSTLTGILNLQDDDSRRCSFLIEYSFWQGKEPTSPVGS